MTQVFAQPTRDAVAKYLLDDEQIRNSFIRALTPFDDVTSSKKLDNALRPLKLDQNLLNILKDESFVQFLKKESLNLPRETKEEKLTHRFFSHLRDNYDEISKVLLDDKGPVSDVICKLSTGDYVLVEVQVNNPGLGVWDKRALAYAAMLFGNQLRKGDDWRNILDVTAVNILGTGQDDKTLFWPEGSYYKRHYRFRNDLETPALPLDNLSLIQYSLGNADLATIQNPEERAWLDFFKNAHRYNSIPKECPEIMKLAYERIVTDTLPPNIKDLYETEEQQIRNFGQRFLEEREEGKLEGVHEGKLEIARNMLSGDVDSETIKKFTGLSLKEIQSLKSSL